MNINENLRAKNFYCMDCKGIRPHKQYIHHDYANEMMDEVRFTYNLFAMCYVCCLTSRRETDFQNYMEVR